MFSVPIYIAPFGNRINNLSGTKGETLSQLIANVNINATITEEFSFGLNYSNFGIRNNRQNNTLKIANVSNSISINPTLMLVGEKIRRKVNIFNRKL